MNHLTKIIEEEKKAFEELYPPVTIGYDGNETDYFRREKFLEILDQAMTKAILAVVEEIKNYRSPLELETGKVDPTASLFRRQLMAQIKSTLTKE